MSYRVEVPARVQKRVDRLRDKALQRRIIRALRSLEENPRPPGCVKLSGSADVYRVRVGGYRIVYQIQDAVLLVLVIDIGHRREIYR